MSLTVKFLNCSTSTTPNQSINMDHVAAYESQDVISNADASKVEYQIIFTMSSLSSVRTIILKYDTSGHRNSSLAAIKAAVNQTTV